MRRRYECVAFKSVSAQKREHLWQGVTTYWAGCATLSVSSVICDSLKMLYKAEKGAFFSSFECSSVLNARQSKASFLYVSVHSPFVAARSLSHPPPQLEKLEKCMSWTVRAENALFTPHKHKKHLLRVTRGDLHIV